MVDLSKDLFFINELANLFRSLNALNVFPVIAFNCHIPFYQ